MLGIAPSVGGTSLFGQPERILTLAEGDQIRLICDDNDALRTQPHQKLYKIEKLNQESNQ